MFKRRRTSAEFVNTLREKPPSMRKIIQYKRYIPADWPPRKKK